MTDHERLLVKQAADAVLTWNGIRLGSGVRSPEKIFDGAGVGWRRQVSLMVATLELARERGMPTTDEKHRSAGIANARVRWGRLAGRGAA